MEIATALVLVITPLPSFKSYTYSTTTSYDVLDKRSANSLTSTVSAVCTTSPPFRSLIAFIVAILSVSVTFTLNVILLCVTFVFVTDTVGTTFAKVLHSAVFTICLTPVPSLRSYSYVTFTVYALLESKFSKMRRVLSLRTMGSEPACSNSIFAIAPTESISSSTISNLTVVFVVLTTDKSRTGIAFLAVLASNSLTIVRTPLPSLRS